MIKTKQNKRYDKFIDFTEKLEKHLTMVPPTELHHRDAWDSLLNVKFLVQDIYLEFLATPPETLNFSELINT